jgi:diguanylate cyclase (GGDEF)-like protein
MDAQALRLLRHMRSAQAWEYMDRGSVKIVALILLALAITGVGALVHATGGIKFVYSHAMYVPVVLAGLVFRSPGGVLAGIAGGLMLGPYMPIDTITGELQKPVNWLYRMFFFSLIGGLSGFLFAVMREHILRTQWVSERNVHTGLPNRMFLERVLRQELGKGTLSPEFLVIVVNIDNYLEIINTLGPDVSKPLMTAVFERINGCLPAPSLLCQYHTDRFVAVTRSDSSRTIVSSITSVLRRSFEVTDIHVYVDASIGMAEFPLHGDEPEELIQKASIAMHASMTRGQAWSIYDNHADQANRETLTLLGLIPEAVAAGEFRLYCQPKLRLADRSYSGAEMLMRWRHPVRGDIPPGQFIPHAERTSLIHLLTKWTLEESFRHLTQWSKAIPGIQVSVNLTARDLGDPDLPKQIENLARHHALRPDSIEFEITETGIVSDQKSAAALLQVIKSCGFRVAIDDFGTGQSSLQYLKNLPIDNLKIDQAFVRNLLTDHRDQSIVKTVIAMAQGLGLEVTAEGVEDLETIEYLAELGCTHAQGYAIARPFPAEDLTAWINNQARPR